MAELKNIKFIGERDDTYLPTHKIVRFYGGTDGNIYAIYPVIFYQKSIRQNQKFTEKQEMRIVRFKDYKYNFEKNIVTDLKKIDKEQDREFITESGNIDTLDRDYLIIRQVRRVQTVQDVENILDDIVERNNQ